MVGPYNYSQLQGSLTQSIFDLVSRRNWQASKESERASQLSAKDARELVVLAVGGSYLQAVATAARVVRSGPRWITPRPFTSRRKCAKRRAQTPGLTYAQPGGTANRTAAA